MLFNLHFVGEAISMKRKRGGAFQEIRDQVARESLAGLKTGYLARKYDISPGTIRQWVREYKQREGVDALPTIDEHIEHAKRIAELEENQERLIKALGEKELEIAVLRELVKKTNRTLANS